MSQWNNPTEVDASGEPVDDGAKAYGQYGGLKGKVTFNVTVEAISIEDATDKAAANTIYLLTLWGLMRLVYHIQEATRASLIWITYTLWEVRMLHTSLDICWDKGFRYLW